MSRMINDLAGIQFIGTLVIALVLGAIWLVVHLLFAIGVNRDARAIESRGQYTLFVSPGWWTIVVLLGGPFLAGLYWAMHRSTLAAPLPDQVSVTCPICGASQQFPQSRIGYVCQCRQCHRTFRARTEAGEPEEAPPAES